MHFLPKSRVDEISSILSRQHNSYGIVSPKNATNARIHFRIVSNNFITPGNHHIISNNRNIYSAKAVPKRNNKCVKKTTSSVLMRNRTSILKWVRLPVVFRVGKKTELTTQIADGSYSNWLGILIHSPGHRNWNYSKFRKNNCSIAKRSSLARSSLET